MSRKETILDPWVYDKAIMHLEEEKQKVEELIRKTGIMRRQGHEYSKISLDDAMTLATPALRRIEESLDNVRESVPVLVGPATLDSLMNVPASTHDALTKGHLPFPHMFFEFDQPYTLRVPFVEGEIALRGAQLSAPREDSASTLGRSYCVNSFYENGRGLGRFPLYMSPNSPGRIMGRIGDEAFHIDMEERTVGTITMDDATQQISANHNAKFAFGAKRDIEEIPDTEGLMNILYLCSNLVEYINAHNVTLVKRERTVDSIVRNDRNKKKRVTTTQPYYLVTFRDGLVTEPAEKKEANGKTWDLKWRVYVRGHNRRYRDEEGNIQDTIWVRPSIKGPPGAPWRERRYQFLADKLMAEQALYDRHLGAGR